MCSQIRKVDKDKHIAMLFLILLPFELCTAVNAQPQYKYCEDDAHILSNSPYENNLKHLLESLAVNTPLEEGFFNSSTGNDADQVYGRALCRGDVPRKVCSACVQNASQEIMKECKNKSAIFWYELCQIQYSSQMLSSMMVYTGKPPDSNDHEKNVSDPGRSKGVLRDFMNKLSDEAASGPSNLMFATDKVKFSRNETIYGLAQCTRDINPDDCRNCLDSASEELKSCCSSHQGGTIFSRNCNVRFELHRFYYVSTAVNKWKIWVAVVVPCVSIFILVAGLIGCYVCHCKRSKGTQKDEEKSQSAMLNELATPSSVVITEEGKLVSSEELPFMDLATIKTATENFSDSNKLGQGGFGTVYKGVLPEGKEIAVKRLSKKSWQGLEEFKNEVILIAKLQHRNLVRLVGCGREREEKLLLYEYMPNKSLDTFIFDSQRRAKLHWDIRLNIINGIARGLLYLHEDSRLKIIHRDLKPNNVLLDPDMVAKISDFGMARMFGENQKTATTRRIVGTYGYMAPEYAMEGLFSVKSDVFSFGVILLEIISGKRNSGFYLTEHAQSLLAYAWRLWNEGKELEFVDPLLTESCPMEKVVRCIHIALLCVQEDPSDRPTMSSVVVLLERESIALPKPRQPAFSVGKVHHIDKSSTAGPSTNQVTLEF